MENASEKNALKVLQKSVINASEHLAQRGTSLLMVNASKKLFVHQTIRELEINA